MHAITALELLDVWEYGLSRSPAQRALELLAVAYPETPRSSWAALSIGQRDASLLALREELWGPRMAAAVVCPGCRERLELVLDTREILKMAPAPHQNRASSLIPLSVAGYTMTFRIPTSLDVAEASDQADNEEDFSELIIERCIVTAQQGEAPVEFHQLPTEVIAKVVDQIAEADPLADIELDLTCPSCKQGWSAVFDIVSFLWTEIEVWAWRILSDVHTLARAYRWPESEILNLTPLRRQFYLEMVGA